MMMMMIGGSLFRALRSANSHSHLFVTFYLPNNISNTQQYKHITGRLPEMLSADPSNAQRNRPIAQIGRQRTTSIRIGWLPSSHIFFT